MAPTEGCCQPRESMKWYLRPTDAGAMPSALAVPCGPRMVAIAAAILLLDPRLHLNAVGPDHVAAVGEARTVRVDVVVQRLGKHFGDEVPVRLLQIVAPQDRLALRSLVEDERADQRSRLLVHHGRRARRQRSQIPHGHFDPLSFSARDGRRLPHHRA